MKWNNEEWTIECLYDKYNSNKINLAPDYQRNPIWNSKAQKLLIDTILSPKPIPNFFLLKKSEDKFEMVDGQQRARTIFNYITGLISSSRDAKFDSLQKESQNSFMKYKLNITLITDIDENESIEEFYALVNSTGLRLNAPELRKAQYFDTKFLSLCTEMANDNKFSSLGIFSSSTIIRMNDIELTSELLSLLHFGNGDKKDDVERLFKEDIDDSESEQLRDKFIKTVDVLYELNSDFPINRTRYKQRADIYTLFGFISKNIELSISSFQKYYDILLFIAMKINPSQEHCKALKDYAINCVSQSNSKTARNARSKFFDDLLRNPSNEPNIIQKDIIKYFGLNSELIEIEKAWTLILTNEEQE
jgi:hypothetical protein